MRQTRLETKKGKIGIYIFNGCRYKNSVTEIFDIYCCVRVIGHLNTPNFFLRMKNQTCLKFLLEKKLFKSSRLHVFYKNAFLKNFLKIQRKTYVPESCFQ